MIAFGVEYALGMMHQTTQTMAATERLFKSHDNKYIPYVGHNCPTRRPAWKAYTNKHYEVGKND